MNSRIVARPTQTTTQAARAGLSASPLQTTQLVSHPVSEHSPTPYGRSPAEWERLARAGRKFLIERARMGRPTSYTEMNAVLHQRTGLPPFNFDLDHDRAAMGYLLGCILELDQPTSGRMITALVNYLDQNDAGPGFYRIAQEYGLLRQNASEQDKFEFWACEVTAVYEHYRPHP
jgi:hypothetical protein